MKMAKPEFTSLVVLPLVSSLFCQDLSKTNPTQASKRHSRTAETVNRTTGQAQGLPAAERKTENRYRKTLLLILIYGHL